jgi:phage gp16-like protein
MAGLGREHYAVLKVAQRELGLDEDTYRDVLWSAAGVKSAKELDLKTFRRVMARLEELGFRGQRHDPRVGARPAGDEVSPAQQQKLQALYAEVGMWELRRQQGFCRRQIRRPWPQTSDEASCLIEALKKMAARGYDAGPRASSEQVHVPND